MNRVRWIQAENFNVVILKKGNFFYICLTNHATGKYLDDDEGKKPNK